jgi:hypothetical protein
VWSWSARAGGCGNGVVRVRGGVVCGRRRVRLAVDCARVVVLFD